MYWQDRRTRPAPVSALDLLAGHCADDTNRTEVYMTTKNKLGDLNQHLFAQLDRLTQENLSPEQLQQEIARATAMVDVADCITENAKLQLGAAKLFAEHGHQILDMLPQIGKSEA
jgi:hypothetical protein